MIDPFGLDVALNWLDPVAREHPRNAGLVAWWLARPEGMGGPTWRDLMGTTPLALAAGATWRPTARPGGWGSVATDGGATGHADGTPTFRLGATWTVGMWANCADPDAQILDYTLSFGSGGSIGPSFFLGGNYLGASIGVYDGTNTSQTNTNSYNTFDNANIWRRIVFTYDAARTQTLQVYMDGMPLGMLTNDMTGSTWPQGDLRLGARVDSPGSALTFIGLLDDVAVWNRTYSDGDAWADFEESRRGYPGALNRIGPSASLSASAVSVPATFAATLGGVSLASSAVFADPASFASTLGGASLAAAATANPPGDNSAFAATLGGVSLASSATFATPTRFASTLAGVSLSAAAAVSAGPSAATFAASLGGVQLAALVRVPFVLHRGADPRMATSRRVGPDPSKSTSKRK